MKFDTNIFELYRTTDSISEKEKLGELIVEVCENYLAEIVKTHRKYEDFPSWLDSDYSPDRGSLSLVDIEEDTIVVRYSDSWRYGGHCDFEIHLKINDVLTFNANSLEVSVKNKRIAKLRQEIVGHKKKITEAEKKIEELQ